MKLSILKLILVLGLGASITAKAGLYTYIGGPDPIPDGSLGGISSQVIVSGELPTLADVTVTLHLSGGYNGDLYAFLSYDGKLVPLLNRIGVSAGTPFGGNGAGMNVILSDAGVGNIHAAGDGFLNGTYRADGQDISPVSPPGDFNANGGSITLDGTFGGMDPNGTWTLFFADGVTGGGTSLLNSWSLNITAVPEPVNMALGVFGLCLAGAGVGRRIWRREPRMDPDEHRSFREGRR